VNVLVVGGAGYIGSHMVKMLARAGHDVTTFDNLSTGHRDAVKYGHFVQGDLADRAALDALFREKPVRWGNAFRLVYTGRRVGHQSRQVLPQQRYEHPKPVGCDGGA